MLLHENHILRCKCINCESSFSGGYCFNGWHRKEVVLTPALRPNLIWEKAGIEIRTTNAITIIFFMIFMFKLL